MLSVVEGVYYTSGNDFLFLFSCPMSSLYKFPVGEYWHIIFKLNRTKGGLRSRLVFTLSFTFEI